MKEPKLGTVQGQSNTLSPVISSSRFYQITLNYSQTLSVFLFFK